MKRMMLGACLATACLGTATAANLVLNGSFETDAVPTLPGYLGGAVPTGWQPLSGPPDIITTGYSGGSAQDGVNFVDLIGGGAGSLPSGVKQSLTLTAGIAYAVSFYYHGDGSQRTLEYSLGSLDSASLDVSGSNLFTDFGPTTPWKAYAVSVTPPVTGTYVLEFAAAAGEWGSPYLDNVSVMAVSVPEAAPARIALGAALGLAALQVGRRPR